MSYEAEISRVNPTCFLFLMDQSGSMDGPIMGVTENPSKADFIADAINKIIQGLVVQATKDVEIRRYYQIGVIGYGNNLVEPLYGGALSGQELVWVDDLYQNPLRIEDRMKKESDGAGGFIETAVKFPVWFDPQANGNTPMCQALSQAERILKFWVQEHQNSYPPTVINLTDGEATDGDPRIEAQALKSLSTMDGNVALMTIHVSSNPNVRTVYFPSNEEELYDTPSKVMFEMSSYLTHRMIQVAKEYNIQNLNENARGIVYQATLDVIVQALDIGTRPANLR